jgi:aryl-alcohol dehydrogenase-like predicted oxidoreductase
MIVYPRHEPASARRPSLRWGRSVAWSPMDTRPLGTTGLEVSPIGLGLAAIGRPAYLTAGRALDLGADRSVEAMEARTHALLDTALELGIRYLDAARSYGYAERFLGTWLRARAVPVEAVVVGSKWGYRYVGDWRLDAGPHEVKDHSLAALQAQLPESRRHLAPWLRLMQIHSATLDSGVLEDTAVLGALATLRADGLHAGLSVSGPHQADTIRRALEVRVDGVSPFTCVQATWNVLEPSAGVSLAEAHDAGWGVIVKEVLANGRLVPGGTDSAVLDRIATRHASTADAVAIAAVLEQPWADVVLSGAVAPSHLRSNAGALALTLDDEDRDALRAKAEPPDRYWAARAARPWT